MSALNLKPAAVVKVESEREGIQNLLVEVQGQVERAVNYLALGDRVEIGQTVLVNTTAVDLSLGSGGCHFVVPVSARLEEGWGHQMKLRYTPLQVKVNCIEEQDSPWHGLFQTGAGLKGIPVLAAELHSMLPPLALAIKHMFPAARISYVATDGGALPAAFSRNAAFLRGQGVISHIITAGHSFGGDMESVNVFTGLQAAALPARADFIIAAMGPGIAGTGTMYGFSGLEQGFVLQAAHVMGGEPVLVPRVGFQDQRERHRGISHHSRTVLVKAYAGRAWVPLPLLGQPQRGLIHRQAALLPRRCRVRWRDGSYIAKIARQYPQMFVTMGKNYDENREFYLALGAAARFAVELYRSKPHPTRIAIK